MATIDYKDPYNSEALYLVNTYHPFGRIDSRWMYYEVLGKPEAFRYLSTLNKRQFLYRLNKALITLQWKKESNNVWNRPKKFKKSLKVFQQSTLYLLPCSPSSCGPGNLA